MDDLFKDIFDNDDKKEVNPREPIFGNTEAPIIREETEAAPAAQTPEPAAETEAPSEPAPVYGETQQLSHLPDESEEETATAYETVPLSAPAEEAAAPQEITPQAEEPAAPAAPIAPPIQPVYQQPTPEQSYSAPTYDRAVFYQPPIQPPATPIAPPAVPTAEPRAASNNFEIPPAFNQQRVPRQEVPPVQAPQSPAFPAPEKKRKNTARIVIIIIAVIAVAISFTGIIYAINHSNTSSKSNDSSSNIFEEFGKNGNDSSDDNTDDAQAEVKSSEEAEKKNGDGSYTVAGVVEQTKDSCVGITVYAQQDSFESFGDFYGYGNEANSDGDVKSGEGSGVIMSEANGKTYIITCAHVIEEGTKFTVTLDNDKEYDARFVGSDAQTDIGVLVIDATGLQVAEFGDSEDINVGEDCVAIGCPGGLEFKNSVTKGIVSALAVPVESKIGYNNECIQIDAAINPGNSGGALFNMQGQVIGINSSKIASTEYEGMGFAVPSNTAVKTANALIKDGYVKGRAKLGITYATLSMMTSDGGSQILAALEKKGFKDCEGAMIISEVDSESGLYGKVEKNDMIVAANGETMTSVDILTSILAKSKPGDTVKLTIARIDGNNIKTFEVSCKLIEAKD